MRGMGPGEGETAAGEGASTGSGSSLGPNQGPGPSSRDRILARVRAAVADTREAADAVNAAKAATEANTPGAPTTPTTPDVSEVPRDYLTTHTPDDDPAAVLDLLHENLAEYRALVHRTDAEGLPALLARLLDEHGSSTVLVPPRLPLEWLGEAGAVRVQDRSETTAAELDAVDSVVTGCALAIAETGTIVLDGGPDQGRRRITLVPDHHICVVRAPEQVVASVPQAMPRLDPTRPLTWISGPSATSDIELDRVEGVHGPRTLEVVLVSG